jgi:hypothetical protein
MTATTPSTALATVQPVFTDAERLALAGFHGLTREAYTLDQRQFAGWCLARSLPLFAVRSVGIETFTRELEAKGRARATVTRRLCSLAGFCKYAVEDELPDHPRPPTSAGRGWTTSRTHCPGPQRVRSAPGRGRARDACGARADLIACPQRAAGIGGDRRGHRAPRAGARPPDLVITREGGKVVTIPPAPCTARAIDLAISERTEGPLFVTANGKRGRYRISAVPPPTSTVVSKAARPRTNAGMVAFAPMALPAAIP